MFDKYGTPETTHWITAANAEYAYGNTANGSLLRKFVRNLVVSDEPLSRRAISDKKDPETMRSNGRGCLGRAEILCWMSLWRVLFRMTAGMSSMGLTSHWNNQSASCRSSADLLKTSLKARRALGQLQHECSNWEETISGSMCQLRWNIQSLIG